MHIKKFEFVMPILFSPQLGMYSSTFFNFTSKCFIWDITYLHCLGEIENTLVEVPPKWYGFINLFCETVLPSFSSWERGLRNVMSSAGLNKRLGEEGFAFTADYTGPLVSQLR